MGWPDKTRESECSNLEKGVQDREVYLFIGIFILSTIFFFLDTSRCNKGNPLLFLHNLTSSFGNFGWLSNNVFVLKMFILVNVIMVVMWALNSNLCLFTELHNKACHLPKNQPFNELFYWIGFKQYPFWNKYGHYIFTTTVFSISVYKLWQMVKINK